VKFKRQISRSDRKVWNWLNKIAKPNPKIGNNSVCPYINSYKDNIMVVQTATPWVVIDSFSTFKDIFKLEAVVIHGFDWDFDTMHSHIDTWNKKYKKRDVFVLGMHPDTEEPPLPLEYNYSKPLIIVQKHSTLKQARHKLAKTTDYYTYHSS